MRSALTAPLPGEYAPFYGRYVAAVIDANVPAILASQPEVLRAACSVLSEGEALHRYSPEKWSVKEVIGHLTDAERIFAYRALRIGRGDQTPLSSFDENAYVAAADFDRLPLGDLVDDFETARQQTLALLRTFGDEAWERLGTASEKPVSARAMFYIAAGHTRHHLRILADRYGVPVEGEEGRES